jgi:hypothetical protein
MTTSTQRAGVVFLRPISDLQYAAPQMAVLDSER